MIKKYLSLTKPGVLFANALTTAAGFVFASHGNININLFLWTLIGSTLIIASACTINNYLDQDIDKLMARTKKRVLVTGEANAHTALGFGITLGVLGALSLYLFVSFLVLCIGVTGFIVYVYLYGALSKRRSVHGTLVGSVSGAIPILAGYVAAHGSMDLTALILFMIMFVWQLPEFYSISVYRQKEYKKAGVPVISVVKGIPATIVQIFVYTLVFVALSISLWYFGPASYTYLVIMALLGGRWILLGLDGFTAQDTDQWARKMFNFSLYVLLAFCFLISIDNILP